MRTLYTDIAGYKVDDRRGYTYAVCIRSAIIDLIAEHTCIMHIHIYVYMIDGQILKYESARCTVTLTNTCKVESKLGTVYIRLYNVERLSFIMWY